MKTIPFLIVCWLMIVNFSHATSQDDFFHEKGLPLEKVKVEADYTIEIDATKLRFRDTYNIKGIKQYEQKELIVIIKYPDNLKIDFDYRKFSDLLVGNSRNSNFNFVDGKITTEVKFVMELFPQKSGIQQIDLSSDDGKLTVKILVHVDENNIEKIIKEIGFEDAIKEMTRISELKDRFGKPQYRSETFKDGTCFYIYHFKDYNIGYQILAQDQNIIDYKRYVGKRIKI